MMLGKLDYFLTACTKLNSKWIKYLNVGSETIKLLRENVSSRLFDISHSNIWRIMSPQASETKAKLKGTTSN